MVTIVLKSEFSLNDIVNRYGISNDEILSLDNGRITLANIGVDFNKCDMVQSCKK